MIKKLPDSLIDTVRTAREFANEAILKMVELMRKGNDQTCLRAAEGILQLAYGKNPTIPSSMIYKNGQDISEVENLPRQERIQRLEAVLEAEKLEYNKEKLNVQ